MTRKALGAVRKLLERLQNPEVRLAGPQAGRFSLGKPGQPAAASVSEASVRALISSGLLQEIRPGEVVPSDVAGAWLKRQGDSELGFLRQHHAVEPAPAEDRAGPAARKNVEESPVAALARKAGPHGTPYLSPEAVTAAERFRRDFEMGQLQPRVTANWTASVSRGRRGDAAIADLTDMALAARLRFHCAIEAVGPELSGLLVDVCCFLKGLATVERERQWPARSAKLVLRLGLEALARHYGLRGSAVGKDSAPMRHWGAEDFRPEIS